MKIISVLLVLFATPAFANVWECVRPLEGNQQQYTVADTWPMLRAQTVVRTCTGGGGLQFCINGRADTISDYNEVCGYPIYSDWECQTRQYSDATNSQYIETSCPRWNVKAVLRLRPNLQGRLTCYSGTTVMRQWQLGQCRWR